MTGQAAGDTVRTRGATLFVLLIMAVVLIGPGFAGQRGRLAETSAKSEIAVVGKDSAALAVHAENLSPESEQLITEIVDSAEVYR